MHQWQQIALSIEPVPGATKFSHAPRELSTFERTVAADNIVYKVVTMAIQRLVENQHAKLPAIPIKNRLGGMSASYRRQGGWILNACGGCSYFVMGNGSMGLAPPGAQGGMHFP